MSLNDALICAWHVDGRNSRTLTSTELQTHQFPKPWWIHLNREVEGVDQWLSEHLSVPEAVTHGLLQQDTRPRCDGYDQGLMLILRGVNLNPGAEPEDMLSLRLWVTGEGIVSLRGRPSLAVQALRERFEAGSGPASLGQLLVSIIAALTERLSVRLENLDAELDALEDSSRSHRQRVEQASWMRARVVRLRRFIAPQAQAIQRVLDLAPDWLGEQDRAFLRNAVDAVHRVTEALDELRERTSILRDDLASTLNERMNSNMYTFTVLTGIFMPLTFVTGLLGVNVSGIPSADMPDAFTNLCLLLVGLLVVEIVLLLRLRMLR